MDESKINKGDYSILVVDDQQEVLEAVMPILEMEGYKVFGAQSGSQAIELVKKEKIDLLLVDFFMPEMNGDKVVAEIRKFNKDIVIVLQTGYSGEKPPIQMLEDLDIQGYHDKTEGPEKLLLWVTSAIKTCVMIREKKRMLEEIAAAMGK